MLQHIAIIVDCRSAYRSSCVALAQRSEPLYTAVSDIFRTLENPVRPRKFSLETPTARLRLPPQGKPHWQRLGRGLSIGYRRNDRDGSWSLLYTDASGAERLKKFAIADDFEPADGKKILNYSQAVEAARKLAGGDAPSDNAALTVRAALAAYEVDLRARDARAYSARWPLKYLPAALATRPVALIDTQTWRQWRDSLDGKLTDATINRVISAVSAALNLAAAHDARLADRRPWRLGLQKLPNAVVARNMILDNDQVRALVEAAYARDDRFGLLAEVLAQTGARASQVARITVGDLRLDNPKEPRLLVPRSGKGGGRLRASRKADRTSVPITEGLAARLRPTAAGRDRDAPLLLRRGGRGWGVDPSGHYRADMHAAVVEAGLDPREVTAYALRHSSICRQLMANTPVRIVAALHDTSIVQIERHYSRFISEHSDQLARKTLLQLDAPSGGNVVAIGKVQAWMP